MIVVYEGEEQVGLLPDSMQEVIEVLLTLSPEKNTVDARNAYRTVKTMPPQCRLLFDRKRKISITRTN